MPVPVGKIGLGGEIVFATQDGRGMQTSALIGANVVSAAIDETAKTLSVVLQQADNTPRTLTFSGGDAKLLRVDGEIPIPVETLVGALVVSPEGVYHYFQETHHSIEPQVGWEAYSNPLYIGAHNSDRNLQPAISYPAGTFWYHTVHRNWLIRQAYSSTIADWVNVSPPTGWIYPGHYRSRDEAASAVSAVGQIAFTGFFVERVATYVAGTPAATAYYSVKLLQVGEELESISRLTALPSSANADFGKIYGLDDGGVDGIYYKRKSGGAELYLRADNITKSFSSTLEFIGFNFSTVSQAYSAGGEILPSRPDWLLELFQEFTIGGSVYEIKLATDGTGPILPATATIRLSVSEIGTSTVQVITLNKEPGSTAWLGTVNTRIFTSGNRYTIQARLGSTGDDYLSIGTEGHLSRIADIHDLDALEGELRNDLRSTGGTINSILDIGDTPAAFKAGQFWRTNAEADGIEQTPDYSGSRGTLWGISSVLATAAGTSGDPLGGPWSRGSGAPAGVTSNAAASALNIPLIPPIDNIDGIWAVAEVDDVEIHAVPLGWGGSGRADASDNNYATLKLSDTVSIDVVYHLSKTAAASYVRVESTGVAIPADTVIKIYAKLAGGGPIGGSSTAVLVGTASPDLTSNDVFYATDIDIPSVNESTWLFVSAGRPIAGDSGDKTGEYIRIRLSELYDDVAAAAATHSTTVVGNALLLDIRGTTLYIGRTAAGKFLVGSADTSALRVNPLTILRESATPGDDEDEIKLVQALPTYADADVGVIYALAENEPDGTQRVNDLYFKLNLDQSQLRFLPSNISRSHRSTSDIRTGYQGQEDSNHRIGGKITPDRGNILELREDQERSSSAWVWTLKISSGNPVADSGDGTQLRLLIRDLTTGGAVRTITLFGNQADIHYESSRLFETASDDSTGTQTENYSRILYPGRQYLIEFVNAADTKLLFHDGVIEKIAKSHDVDVAEARALAGVSALEKRLTLERGDSRGDKIATYTFAGASTSTPNNNVELTTLSYTPGGAWELLDAADTLGFALDASTRRLNLPAALEIPDEVIGLWAVASVTNADGDDVEYGRGSFIPWGGANYNSVGITSNFVQLTSSQRIQVREYVNESPQKIALFGSNTTFPAGVKIHIYEAVVRGAKGDPGAAASGQQSPATDDDALTEYRTGVYSARLWQKAAAIPAAPPSDWWTDNGITPSLGNWHKTRLSAASIPGAGNIYFALDQVTVSPAGGETYDGWDIHQEFDVDYSADGTTWHTAQVDGDLYFGFRLPDGTRRVVQIASDDDGWTNVWLNQIGYSVSASAGASHAFAVNLENITEMRIRLVPFGYWSGGVATTNGAVCEFVVPRTFTNHWGVHSIDDDADTSGVYSLTYDEVEGLVVAHQQSAAGLFTLPSDIVRGNNQPAQRISYKIKLIAPDTNDPNNVTRIRIFGQTTAYTYALLSIWVR